MASIQRQSKGWRAQVARRGVRESKVFSTQREAKDWAARREAEILDHAGVSARLPLRDVLDRYAREVSPSKRGHRWEVVRLEKIARDPLGAVRMGDLSPRHLAEWRDRRLLSVKPASVRREMTLLSSVIEVARREWQVIAGNPARDVAKPAEPPPRDRLPTADEIERLQLAAGSDLSAATARAFHAFLFAGASAMRAGELCGLRWGDIDVEARTAFLAKTKSGTSRTVPMERRALDLLLALPSAAARRGSVFDLSPQQLDSLWRKVARRAAVEDLRFHDSRAWALTELSRRVDAMTLARISGHRDLNMLLNVYYRETAAQIAKRLD